jgi:hypothetical protein
LILTFDILWDQTTTREQALNSGKLSFSTWNHPKSYNLHQAEGKCTEYMCGDGVSAVFTKRVWMRLDVVGIGFVKVLVMLYNKGGFWDRIAS